MKKQAPVAFATLVKPIGSTCNLDCQYCYYLDKADLYEGRQACMNDELLEAYIRQYIEGNDVPVITFCWHGGEPLMTGLDFYRRAVELQKKYAGEKKIENTLQTNGTLITEEWCRFFADNNFLVGLSIDGPRDIHDAYRTNKGGEPTFDKVMKAVELMTRHKAEFNTLSVVNNLSEGRGAEVYQFMKSIGSRYMQFLPVVEHVKDVAGSARGAIVPPYSEGSRLAEWSVSAEGYGRFMIDIFDRWVIQDVGQYFVQLFDVALAQWFGVRPGLCAFCETCGDGLVVEHNGDVYSCDHFVYPKYKLGNIQTDDLKTLFTSSAQFDFGVQKRSTLPRECLRCDYYFACRGECPKHRFEVSAAGEPGKNTLCQGFKMFFKHADPYMKYMTELLKNEKPAYHIIPWARQRMGLFF